MDKDFRLLADCFLSVMEGDDHRIDEAYSILRKYGFCDEDGFPTDFSDNVLPLTGADLYDLKRSGKGKI